MSSPFHTSFAAHAESTVQVARAAPLLGIIKHRNRSPSKAVEQQASKSRRRSMSIAQHTNGMNASRSCARTSPRGALRKGVTGHKRGPAPPAVDARPRNCQCARSPGSWGTVSSVLCNPYRQQDELSPR